MSLIERRPKLPDWKTIPCPKVKAGGSKPKATTPALPGRGCNGRPSIRFSSAWVTIRDRSNHGTGDGDDSNSHRPLKTAGLNFPFFQQRAANGVTPDGAVQRRPPGGVAFQGQKVHASAGLRPAQAGQNRMINWDRTTFAFRILPIQKIPVGETFLVPQTAEHLGRWGGSCNEPQVLNPARMAAVSRDLKSPQQEKE